MRVYHVRFFDSSREVLALLALAGLFSVPHCCRASSPGESADPYIWRSAAIHGGGFVSGIVSHPGVAGLIYARTDVGGAYRWDAENKSWVAITDWISQSDGNLMGCESIAIDPSDPDRVYLALGLYTNSWGKNGAIARSNDHGKTFERTNMPFKMGGNCPGRSMGERLVVDPNDGQILFFGSRAAGLWKSTDQAKTWAPVQAFPAAATSSDSVENDHGTWPLGIAFVKFDQTSGHKGSPTPVVYAGICCQQTSLYRSTNGGANWIAVPGQPVGLRPNHLAIGSKGLFYISYGDQAGPNGMTDGALWQFNSKNDQWVNITPAKPTAGDTFGYGAVTIDAQHPDTLMACSMDRWGHGDTVFRSTDAGKIWSSQTVGGHYDKSNFDAADAPWGMSLAPHWLGDIEIDPFDSQHVMFVTGFGIWATHNASALDSARAAHWSFEDRGLEETVPLELISPPAGPHLISVIGDFDGFTHDNLDVSPAAGRHWPQIGSSSGLDFAGALPSRIVRSGGYGQAFYSDDSGETWTALATYPKDAKNGGEIALSSDGQTILWQCGGSKTYRSTNLGKTWTPCQGLPRPLHPVADKVAPNRFYCFDNQSGEMFVSQDGGATFAMTARDLPQGDSSSVRAVPGNTGDLWLVAARQLYRSIDAGHSFAKVNSIDKADRFGFGKAPPGKEYPTIFLSGLLNGVDGIFRSDDTGQSWQRIDDDQHRYGYLDVVIGDPRVFGRVYVGTSGRGIVYGDLATASK